MLDITINPILSVRKSVNSIYMYKDKLFKSYFKELTDKCIIPIIIPT